MFFACYIRVGRDDLFQLTHLKHGVRAQAAGNGFVGVVDEAGVDGQQGFTLRQFEGALHGEAIGEKRGHAHNLARFLLRTLEFLLPPMAAPTALAVFFVARRLRILAAIGLGLQQELVIRWFVQQADDSAAQAGDDFELQRVVLQMRGWPCLAPKLQTLDVPSRGDGFADLCDVIARRHFDKLFRQVLRRGRDLGRVRVAYDPVVRFQPFQFDVLDGQPRAPNALVDFFRLGQAFGLIEEHLRLGDHVEAEVGEHGAGGDSAVDVVLLDFVVHESEVLLDGFRRLAVHRFHILVDIPLYVAVGIPH